MATYKYQDPSFAGGAQQQFNASFDGKNKWDFEDGISITYGGYDPKTVHQMYLSEKQKRAFYNSPQQTQMREDAALKAKQLADKEAEIKNLEEMPDKIRKRDEQNKVQSGRRQSFSGYGRAGTILTGGLGSSGNDNALLGVKKTLLGQ